MATLKAIGLIRVSTPDQQLGLEAQRAAIQRFAAEHGIDVPSIHTEVVSGGAPMAERHGLIAAMLEVEATGALHLIVAKRDRLSRDPLTAMLAERKLGDAGATVLCVDGNNAQDPQSVFMRRILDAAAELERAMIGIRTKAALQALKARGVKLGGRKAGARNKSYGGPRKTRSDKGKPRKIPSITATVG